MYHIKNDKRSIQSANKIFDGLSLCLKKKSFQEITISEICKTSNVGRATFYRIFDNISDVLFMKCDLAFKEVLQGFIADNDLSKITRFSLLHYYLNYWLINYEIIETIIRANRIDIIYSCHRSNSKIISSQFRKTKELTEIEHKYLLAIRSGETLGLLITWIEGGRKENVEELFEIIKRILSVGESTSELLL